MRRSLGQSSHRSWDEWSQCHKLVDCTTATNGVLLERDRRRYNSPSGSVNPPQRTPVLSCTCYESAMQYDHLNRLITKTYPSDSTPWVIYCYDGDASNHPSPARNCAGEPTGSYMNDRLTMVSNLNSTTMFSQC